MPLLCVHPNPRKRGKTGYRDRGAPAGRTLAEESLIEADGRIGVRR